MTEVTRKDFLQSLGASGSCGKIEPAPVVRDRFIPFFIGVGDFGNRLARELARHSDPLGFMDYDQDLKNHIVFLAGNPMDPSFLMIRQRVLAQGPYLVFTIVDGQFPLQPEINEGVITAEDLRTTCQTILHLSNAATIPTIIGLDISDISMVCGGGLLETFHFRRRSEFKEALQNWPDSPHGLLVILCYPDPDSLKWEDYEMVCDALEGNTDPATYLALGVNWHSQSDSELVIISRTSPRQSSWPFK